MRVLDPKSLGQHLDALYRAAWALCGSREDAEDLVQDTFARVLARPRVIHGDERGYLMRTLRNTFYSRLRTASRRPQTTATLDDIQAPDPRSIQQPEQAIEVREVMEAIAALPEDFRLAIVAVDVLGLSYGEAARALDTREATITTRLYRARQRVARGLSPTPPGPDPPGSDTRASDIPASDTPVPGPPASDTPAPPGPAPPATAPASYPPGAGVREGSDPKRSLA